MKYRADIDGLRALAVLPILLFHAGVTAFSGGYVGVDIFFVISGFLIAGIIRDDLEAGRFSVLGFYDRRARRIVPALIFALALTLVGALILLLPDYFVDFSKSLVATGAFISNFYFWKFSGYFENSAQMRPLLHTWSLAVEEQFYIFMPLCMAAIYRFLSKRWVLIFGAAALASLALSIFAMRVGPTANFFLLPTRAWELLLGALLALRPPPGFNSRAVNEALAIAGLGLIGWAVFFYTEATPFPGFTALPPCLGAAILIYVGAHRQTLVGTLLSWKPVVGVGLISYSLYLVHWPIAVFTRYVVLAPLEAPHIIFIVIASFALAMFSWRVIERPFRGARLRWPRMRVLVTALAALLGVTCAGAVGLAGHGFPARFADFQAPPREPQGAWREGACFFEGGEAFRTWSSDACALTRGEGDGVLLWGDSFAAHYIPGIVAHASSIPYRVYAYAFAGCPPVLSYVSYARPTCTAFNRHALDLVRTLHIKRVILSGRWIDLQLRGLDELRSTIDALHALGVDVVVIGQSPIFIIDTPVIAYRQQHEPASIDSWPTILPPTLNQRLRAAAAGATFIDPVQALCSEGRCPFRSNGHFLYGDTGHFTQFGSSQAVAGYLPVFNNIGGGAPPPPP